jgi:hypothetical protein
LRFYLLFFTADSNHGGDNDVASSYGLISDGCCSSASGGSCGECGGDGSGNRVRSMARSCITRSKDRFNPKKKKLRAKYCRMGVRKIS